MVKPILALIIAGAPAAGWAAAPDLQARCVSLSPPNAAPISVASTRIESAQFVAAGTIAMAQQMPEPPKLIDAPEHCEIHAIMQERIGESGQRYAIKFHLRLPTHWNHRFLFSGGSGSNGAEGDALGAYSASAVPALLQGFAVVSQDSGHDNAVNFDPARGGALVFGFDSQARANYGYASLPQVTIAAKALIKKFYGTGTRYSYFVGCSKGGEEGMALAQRYGTLFNGIAAGAPGISLPRAAVAEAWDTQAFASVVKTTAKKSVTLARLMDSFTGADFALVRGVILATCDADDGLVDGIVGDFRRCTTVRITPRLDALKCTSDKNAGCLSAAQIAALVRVMYGARDSQGKALYSDWPWDAGVGASGWLFWKLGVPGSPLPAFNVILGSPSLATVMTVPPVALDNNPQSLLDFQLAFDFDYDAPKIYATSARFPHSAWDDISARSSDLNSFRNHHGKLLVMHGVSDPVFSINDTLAWWQEVDARNHGRAAQFVRVFPVPGMNHCGGGDATDQYDVLPPLMQWVEHARAPSRIIARANATSLWPQRSRPLCPYPAVARYKGSGDIDSPSSFECRD